MIEDIKELYQYREMLKNLVKKDLRTRYKGSVLGFLWTFVNPLLQLVVFTIVFSTVMRINIDKFYMFLFVALLPWIFFSTSVQVSAGTIIANKDLVKKIYFPKAVLPLSVVTSGLMNLLFSFVIVFIVLIISKIGITINIIYLPLVIFVEYLITLGISLLVSSLNVYFRDLEHILGVLLMGWFYFTPIIYPVEMIPKSYLKLFFLNPITPIIISFRDILYYGKAPDFVMLGLTLLIGLFTVIFGYNVFKILQKNFAEEI
ncbi:MAG: lipopolysaccharide transport system permease protein [Thermosediminibacterales bacterium]|nr:lipopolysaccharide transport system permease protein [Thermosediminibacterales bacterium]MDK2835610.1 lipopolysaccharide transport system permease protein [Thermosediminibacterales bacterium]